MGSGSRRGCRELASLTTGLCCPRPVDQEMEDVEGTAEENWLEHHSCLQLFPVVIFDKGNTNAAPPTRTQRLN